MKTMQQIIDNITENHLFDSAYQQLAEELHKIIDNQQNNNAELFDKYQVFLPEQNVIKFENIPIRYYSDETLAVKDDSRYQFTANTMDNLGLIVVGQGPAPIAAATNGTNGRIASKKILDKKTNDKIQHFVNFIEKINAKYIIALGTPGIKPYHDFLNYWESSLNQATTVHHLIDTEDGEALKLTDKDYDLLVDLVKYYLAESKKTKDQQRPIYIHCKAGNGRSAAFAFILLLLIDLVKNSKLSTIYQKLTKEREGIELNDDKAEQLGKWINTTLCKMRQSRFSIQMAKQFSEAVYQSIAAFSNKKFPNEFNSKSLRDRSSPLFFPQKTAYNGADTTCSDNKDNPDKFHNNYS